MTKTKIVNTLAGARRIAIMGHRKGDSDSFGSMLALKLALEKLGKNVSVYSEAPLPDYLSFLGEFIPQGFKEALDDEELLVILDCSEEGIVSFPDVLENARSKNLPILQIDHHVAGEFAKTATISLVNSSACATAEIIYDVISHLGIKFDKQIATALLAGIEGDTASFQNQNTTESCMVVASELISKGARLNKIIKNSEKDKDIETLKLWGLVLERLKVLENGVAISFLSYKDAEKLGIKKSSFGAVTNFLNSIKGAKMLMLVTEESEGNIKVSLRTRDENVDVAKIAKEFGGGGHVKAAGFTFSGTLVVENGLPKIV